jgi:hypothetical protein
MRVRGLVRGSGDDLFREQLLQHARRPSTPALLPLPHSTHYADPSRTCLESHTHTHTHIHASTQARKHARARANTHKTHSHTHIHTQPTQPIYTAAHVLATDKSLTAWTLQWDGAA